MGPLFPRPASARRPLASATASLHRPLPRGGAASTARRRHGAEVLTDLIDFEGAVHLAQTLRTLPSSMSGARSASEPPPPDDAAPGGGFEASPRGAAYVDALARAQRRLDEAGRRARHPLQDPRGDAPLVPAARMERLLSRAGVPAARRRAAIVAAARELFAPIEARAAQRIAAVRALVREVRDDLGPVIAGSGPRGARLEQIDAALTRATAARCDALLGRALGAASEAFAEDVERAVLALPRPCLEVPVLAWTAPGGLVATHVERCENLVVATFLHERARLEMLVVNTLGPLPVTPAPRVPAALAEPR